VRLHFPFVSLIKGTRSKSALLLVRRLTPAPPAHPGGVFASMDGRAARSAIGALDPIERITGGHCARLSPPLVRDPASPILAAPTGGPARNHPWAGHIRDASGSPIAVGG
jgi:hypothetical protein